MVNKRAKWLGGIITLIIFLAVSASADVNVYGEGAYTETDLVVHIYADVTTTAVVSYGVKLTYATSELTVVDVVKNKKDWYFGSQESPLPTPNAIPDTTTTPGEVVIIDGKIDEVSPLEGVIGERTLLAVVTFDRVGSTMPFSPTIGLSLGKTETGKYANFVQVDGVVIDSPDLFGSNTIRERGDANGDGEINFLDYRELRQLIGTDEWPIFSDGNGDGVLDFLDYRWLRQNI